MKAVDLRLKTEDELTKELLALKKQQLNLRFQLSQGQLGNTAQIRTVRRKVAQIKTILAEKGNVDVQQSAKVKKAPVAKKPAAKKAEPKAAAAKKPAAKKTTKKETVKKADK